MTTSTHSPEHATVAFLRIAGFDERGVAEQAASKQALEGLARSAIARLPEADRAVLDAEDGIALVLFGDPSRALETVGAIARDGGEGLKVGINHGPLALSAPGAEARVFGDGIAAASAASRFAAPGKLLATDGFRRILEARDPGRAAAFVPAGDFTDTRVRLHSLYADDPARRSAQRRRAIVRAAMGVFAIVLLGVAARLAHHAFFEPRPATISLAIKPRGEVFVDGVSRGTVPPLKRLEVSAGRHQLVVRHPGSVPLDLALDLKPGERYTVRHTFVPARAQPRSFWRELRRRFGGS